MLDAENVYHRVLQSRLEELFPNTTFSTINAGVSGGNVPQAIERLDRDVLRHTPDLVLVAFGLNDSLAGADGIANFRDGLRFIVRTIREKTDSDVMLLTLPSWHDGSATESIPSTCPWQSGYWKLRIAACSPLMRNPSGQSPVSLDLPDRHSSGMEPNSLQQPRYRHLACQWTEPSR